MEKEMIERLVQAVENINAGIIECVNLNRELLENLTPTLESVDKGLKSFDSYNDERNGILVMIKDAITGLDGTVENISINLEDLKEGEK